MITSIQNQTYSNWELLVTDDSSDDDTSEILEEVTNDDPRIRSFRLTGNKGPGYARNHSLKEAKGRYIAFCDSDDLWMPNKLEKQVEFMMRDQLAFSCTSYRKIDESGNIIRKVRCHPCLTYRDMLRNNYVGCLTEMYDVDQIGKVPMPEIRRRQDWALWLNILRRTDKVWGLNEDLAFYRIRSHSVSSTGLKWIKYNWIVYHDLEQTGNILSIYYSLTYPWHYIMKIIKMEIGFGCCSKRFKK